jgi:hypothetical protein
MASAADRLRITALSRCSKESEKVKAILNYLKSDEAALSKVPNTSNTSLSSFVLSWFSPSFD